VLTLGWAPAAAAGVILLNFDTPATGSEIAAAPLATPLGTVSARFVYIHAPRIDPDLTAAGSMGNYIDWQRSPPLPELLFDFDVQSISFLYGGNDADIRVTAFDAAGSEIGSFYQPALGDGQPAGPATITAEGIRRIQWTTSEMGCACAFESEFLALDNVVISDVETPEPP
jgi:hypothetical protein